MPVAFARRGDQVVFHGSTGSRLFRGLAEAITQGAVTYTDFPAGFLFLVILALIAQNWDVIVRDGPRFAPAFIVLNIASLIVGYFVPKLMGIEQVQALTIAIETGLQNSTVSITVAMTLLNNNEMAVIPGLYAIWMYVTGFALAYLMTRRPQSAS